MLKSLHILGNYDIHQLDHDQFRRYRRIIRSGRIDESGKETRPQCKGESEEAEAQCIFLLGTWLSVHYSLNLDNPRSV